ncbi:sensor histidine kinase [Aquimarina sp. SS2-1]|uniref:sensor histidine kinase n=1 Tax=Aquimarina besae TaxID=3342247 RepID=UPI00366BFCD2
MAFNFNNHKSLIYSFKYWIFALFMGIFLIYIEQIDDIEPLFSILAFIYWSLLIYWAARWLFRQIKSVLKHKKEKNNMELLHLKSQVSPHFFFNTLNNLYGLVEEDHTKAQELILKLSDMMRYSIYEGEQDFVTIDKEIQYLQNYIELHKMRYHKKTDIQFHYDIKDPKSKIMPLCFIILLENAFKHGLENLRTNAFIRLKLTANTKKIIFEIENNFDSTETTKSAGIGLKNLKRRLELVYPKKHSLSFDTAKDIYKARLIIEQI